MSAILITNLINPLWKSKLIQCIHSIDIATNEWDTNFGEDAKRVQYHQAKMASKDTRPEIQLAALNMTNHNCHVIHIIHNSIHATAEKIEIKNETPVSTNIMKAEIPSHSADRG